MSGERAHTGRPWLRRRLNVLNRDQWTCLVPHCKAEQWALEGVPPDKWHTHTTLAWLCANPPRAIWPDAPRNGKRLHPLSASVDMIVPRVLGGSDEDLDLLRASHLVCNAARQAGNRERVRRYVSAPRVKGR